MIKSKSSLYFLVLCLVGAFIALYFVIKPFLGPLIVAAVFAFLSQKLYQKILKIIRHKEGLSALITLVIVIVVVLLPVSFLGGQILRESKNLYDTLANNGSVGFIDMIENAVRNLRLNELMPENFDININQYLQQGLSFFFQNIGGIFSSFARIALSFFVFLMAYYYLLKDGFRLKNYLVALSPLEDKDDQLVIARLKSAVSSVVKGNLLIGLIQGTLTGIGFALFGVPNAVLWGSVASVAALIPGVGTAMVIIPAVIFLFVSDNNFGAVGLLIWGVAAVGMIDNILGPRLIGGGMKLHPLAAFLAVLGGLALFGPLGILLGPLIISISLALVEIYFSLKEKESLIK